MDLDELFLRFEVEFELDMPDDAENTLVCVRDVRDYIREVYREQGIEAPAGAIFERVRRIAAHVTHADASEIEPKTRLADLILNSRAA